jgi:nicotinamidase/pyrazinamidase
MSVKRFSDIFRSFLGVTIFSCVLGGILLFSTAGACPDCAGGKTAAIVVDMQGDFSTWKKGSLAVNGTDEAFFNKVGKAAADLSKEGFLVFATQDWHPANHVSFYTQHKGKNPFELIDIEGRKQVLWPPHCVQGTQNARILVDNNLFMATVKKGKDKRYDSYSGFQDDGGAETEMNKALKRNMVSKVVVFGIATDYCVKATALDAVERGYKVIFVEDLSKGVAPDTTKAALKEMKDKGVVVMKELDVKKINAE